MTLRGKYNGAKHGTEAWDGVERRGGRGALCTGGSVSASTGGQYTSENAGMSSENYVGIIMAENPRFPGEGSSAQGKSGAKLRPKGVGDAQTAEIPSPPNFKPQGHLRITEPRRWLPGA